MKRRGAEITPVVGRVATTTHGPGHLFISCDCVMVGKKEQNRLDVSD